LDIGDSNTKFSHAYANSRKQINTIWDITRDDGTIITNNIELQNEEVDYIQNIFNGQANLAIYDQLVVLRNNPRIFSMGEGIRLVEPITLV
jgi:hypothetical protein